MLDKSGWRQGSLVSSLDLPKLLETVNFSNENNLVAVLASQSCDIASNNIESDPNIELSIARIIDDQNSQLTHNKNPRILHTRITCSTGDENVSSEIFIELKAFEKVSVAKAHFSYLEPDSNKILEDRQLDSYVSWLAARYARPALPSTFNNRIAKIDPKDKLRKSVKKSNDELAGIYVQIIPDTEILDDETYKVNLLGLLPAGFDGNSKTAQNTIDAYTKVLSDAGMNVQSAIRKEDEISVAFLKRFKRFYFDDLSFRENTPHPPETQTILY